MINVIEITIEEFEDKIYHRYVNLFPSDEQREWKKIKETYDKGIEKFYKIINDDVIIGFFILEKLENKPYYLDYFAIFDEYQNSGYGTLSIKALLEDIIKNDSLIAEIEKEREEDPITIKRFKFYERLGFRKIDSEYLLCNVLYTPIIYSRGDLNKQELDKTYLEYYKINYGEDVIKKEYKFIR